MDEPASRRSAASGDSALRGRLHDPPFDSDTAIGDVTTPPTLRRHQSHPPVHHPVGLRKKPMPPDIDPVALVPDRPRDAAHSVAFFEHHRDHGRSLQKLRRRGQARGTGADNQCSSFCPIHRPCPRHLAALLSECPSQRVRQVNLEIPLAAVPGPLRTNSCTYPGRHSTAAPPPTCSSSAIAASRIEQPQRLSSGARLDGDGIHSPSIQHLRRLARGPENGLLIVSGPSGSHQHLGAAQNIVPRTPFAHCHFGDERSFPACAPRDENRAFGLRLQAQDLFRHFGEIVTCLHRDRETLNRETAGHNRRQRIRSPSGGHPPVQPCDAASRQQKQLR